MHDTLLFITQGVNTYPKFLSIATQGFNLGAGGQISDGGEDVLGGGVVILSCDGEVETTQGATFEAQTLKGLG